MFKRILVGVDGSPIAERGLKTAVALAKDQKAALYVLHVVDDSAVGQILAGTVYAMPDVVDELFAALRDGGRKILAKAEAVARKEGVDIRPQLVETLGQSSAEAIVEHARKLRADLIVMGTHGRRGLRRLVMGSDAEAVLREAQVPVLMVRAPTKADRGAGRHDQEGVAARPPKTGRVGS